jgi:hypothetical protein
MEVHKFVTCSTQSQNLAAPKNQPMAMVCNMKGVVCIL